MYGRIRGNICDGVSMGRKNKTENKTENKTAYVIIGITIYIDITTIDNIVTAIFIFV